MPCDLTSNAGLALAGQYLKRLKIDAALDRKFPVGVGGIPNSDILKSYLGLLVQGKNDFDAIEEFRGDDFFAQALNVRVVPSCSTLRQRLDAHAASWLELAGGFNLALLWATYASAPVDFGALPCCYMTVDWDTFVMNNSGTQKEAVGRTYQGVDGFTASATYLGSVGYCLELALRPGGSLVARDRHDHQMESAQGAGRGHRRAVGAGCQHHLVSFARGQTHVHVHAGTHARRCWHTGQSGAPRFSPHRAHHRQARQPTAAGRMIKHAGRWVLGQGANDSAYTVFERLYRQLAPERKTSTA